MHAHMLVHTHVPAQTHTQSFADRLRQFTDPLMFWGRRESSEKTEQMGCS